MLDNEDIILKDSRVHAATPVQLHRILTQQYWETCPDGLYRPVITLSYLFNYTILGNGANPEGYHWLNLLLHLANMGLVYALGMAIFEQAPPSLVLCATWGLHPVLTESVTNIVGRADLMAAFSVLMALLCHLNALRSSGRRKAAWLAAMGLAVTAGMFSKESAIVVLAVIALYDLAFARAISLRSRIPSYIAAGLPCLVFLCVRAYVVGNTQYSPTPFVNNPLVGADFWTARLTAVKVIGKYLWLLVWPARLSYDYSYNEIPLFGWRFSNWEDWKAVFALIACLCAVGVAILSFRRHKPVFFSVLFFFATLSPTSNLLILIGTVMGERFLYLPSIGFAVLMVYAFWVLWRRLAANQPICRQAATATICIILIAFAARTYDRNSDWADQYRFWRVGAETAPGSFKTHLAATDGAFVTREDWVRNIREVGRALAILDGLPDSRNSADAYRQAGSLYRILGDMLVSKSAAAGAFIGTSTETWYRKSLNALLRSERLEFAHDESYRQANVKRGRPPGTSLSGMLYLEMGRTYMRLSDPLHALAAFERGRMLESNPDLLEEIASAYRASGDPRKAAIALAEAYTADPKRVQIVPKLVELYGEIDPGGCAVNNEDGRPSLNVECPLVHRDICTASRNIMSNYSRRGQHFEAAAIRRTAIQYMGCEPGLLN